MGSAINGVKWTSLSAVVNACAKLGQISILTRFLRKEDFGLIAIAVLVISFTEIFMDMGISSAVLHKQDISKNEYSSLYWFNIISGFVISVIICILAPWVAIYYNQPELVNIISLLSLNVIFSSISRLQRTFQQKQMQFSVIAKIDMTASVLMVIFSIVLVYIGLGVYALVFSTLFYGFFIAIIYLSYSVFKDRIIRLHFNFYETKPYLKIGIYQVGSSTLDYLSREMDIFLIGTAYSLEILGVYSVCKQLAFKVYSFINPIVTKVLTPSLALCQDNQFLLREKYINVIRVLSFIDMPIYFFLCYCSSYVLGVIYGSSYVEYSLAFSILCLYYSICSIGNPLGALLVATGRTDIGFYWTIYRIIVTMIVLYFASLSPFVIFVFVIFILNFINLFPEILLIYKPLLNISCSQYIKSFSTPLFISLILSPLVFIHYMRLNSYIGLVIIGILFLLLYVLLSLVYNKKDIILINRFISLDRLSIVNFLFVRLGIK